MFNVRLFGFLVALPLQIIGIKSDQSYVLQNGTNKNHSSPQRSVDGGIKSYQSQKIAMQS